MWFSLLHRCALIHLAHPGRTTWECRLTYEGRVDEAAQQPRLNRCPAELASRPSTHRTLGSLAFRRSAAAGNPLNDLALRDHTHWPFEVGCLRYGETQTSSAHLPGGVEKEPRTSGLTKQSCVDVDVD
jgi:hypothetical protein